MESQVRSGKLDQGALPARRATSYVNRLYKLIAQSQGLEGVRGQLDVGIEPGMYRIRRRWANGLVRGIFTASG